MYRRWSKQGHAPPIARFCKYFCALYQCLSAERLCISCLWWSQDFHQLQMVWCIAYDLRLECRNSWITIILMFHQIFSAAIALSRFWPGLLLLVKLAPLDFQTILRPWNNTTRQTWLILRDSRFFILELGFFFLVF